MRYNRGMNTPPTPIHPPLTPEQREAFRAYMHDLNCQAAVLQGIDPNTICRLCGEDKHPAAPTCDGCAGYGEEDAAGTR